MAKQATINQQKREYMKHLDLDFSKPLNVLYSENPNISQSNLRLAKRGWELSGGLPAIPNKAKTGGAPIKSKKQDWNWVLEPFDELFVPFRQEKLVDRLGIPIRVILHGVFFLIGMETKAFKEYLEINQEEIELAIKLFAKRLSIYFKSKIIDNDGNYIEEPIYAFYLNVKDEYDSERIYRISAEDSITGLIEFVDSLLSDNPDYDKVALIDGLTLMVWFEEEFTDKTEYKYAYYRGYLYVFNT